MDVDQLVDGQKVNGKIILLIGEQAESFFQLHNLCCSESIMAVLNKAFHGGLPKEVGVRMGSGFCEGMGGAGCLCGVLSGSVAMLGLFLGQKKAEGLKNKELKPIVQKMHDRFKERFGSTCCRVLTKKVKHDPIFKKKNCMTLTRGGAEMVAEILLDIKPQLSDKADMIFLNRRNIDGKEKQLTL